MSTSTDSFDRLVERSLGLGVSIPSDWRHGVVRSDDEYRIDAGPEDRDSLPRMTLRVRQLEQIPVESPADFPEWAIRNRLAELDGELAAPPEEESGLQRVRIKHYSGSRRLTEEVFLRGWDRLGWELRFTLGGSPPPTDQLELAERIARGANLDIRREIPRPEVPDDAAFFFDGRTFNSGELEAGGSSWALRRFVHPELGLALSVPVDFVWNDDSNRDRWGVNLWLEERKLRLKLHVYLDMAFSQSMYAKMLTRRLSQHPGMQVQVGPVLPTAFGGVAYLQVVDSREEAARFAEHYVYGSGERIYHMICGQPWPPERERRDVLDAVVRSVRFFDETSAPRELEDAGSEMQPAES